MTFVIFVLVLSQQVHLQVKTVISVKTFPHVAQTDVFMLAYKHLSSQKYIFRWQTTVSPHILPVTYHNVVNNKEWGRYSEKIYVKSRILLYRCYWNLSFVMSLVIIIKPIELIACDTQPWAQWYWDLKMTYANVHTVCHLHIKGENLVTLSWIESLHLIQFKDL